MSKALLIIDIQNDYFPDGAMELVGSENAAINAKQIINVFRNKFFPVIYIQHISNYDGASFFLPNTKGVEINETVLPLPEEKIIKKNYPNSFRDTELLNYLNQNKIKELIICGMMTHMCVDTSVRAAYDLGFSCTLIGDACATKNLKYKSNEVMAMDVQTAYLAAIDGTFAKVTILNEFIKNQ